MRDGNLSAAAMMAERLIPLLGGAAAPSDGAAAWQDSLDLLAVASGIKPVALIGCGYAGGTWLDAMANLAAAGGLAVLRGGMPWLVAEELSELPNWYAAPLRDSWAGADMLVIAREPPRSGLLSLEEEAALLLYPACCVADHHARRRRYHELMVELIAARCETEPERRRFAASELLPPLRSDDDRQRLAEALQAPPLAFVSFNPCPVCVALGERGPAGRIAAHFRDLAMASGFAAPAAIEA